MSWLDEGVGSEWKQMSSYGGVSAYSLSVAQPLALLFTNAHGMVVYADRSFSRLTHCAAEGFDLRGPLHTLLGVSEAVTENLLQRVNQAGHFTGRLLHARTQSGSLLPIWGMSVASYDDREGYIGADILLSSAIDGPQVQARVVTHSDFLNVYLQQTMAFARARHDKTFLQAYMAAQFNVLQVLLVRMAGSEIRDAMERILAGNSRKNNWPISIEHGELAFGKASSPFGVYGAFQKIAVSYAASIVGRRVIAQELDLLDRQLDQSTLALVTQLGLRIAQE